MPVDPALAPLTETVTITADHYGGLTAYTWNGPHRVALAIFTPTERGCRLLLDGAPLRECLPGVDPRDVLDLLAAGKVGDFAVEVRSARPASRRDADFGGAF